MTGAELSLTEHAVLAILGEAPSHGFAIAKELDPESEPGAVFTVPRTLVYRALDRLVASGYAEKISTEKGGGPRRVVHGATDRGRLELRRWLSQPVAHVRDLRIEFLLKVTFLRRSRLSPLRLIAVQRDTLAATFDALSDPPVDPLDHVEQWRRSNATAAARYLETLGHAYRQT